MKVGKLEKKLIFEKNWNFWEKMLIWMFLDNLLSEMDGLDFFCTEYFGKVIVKGGKIGDFFLVKRLWKDFVK